MFWTVKHRWSLAQTVLNVVGINFVNSWIHKCHKIEQRSLNDGLDSQRWNEAEKVSNSFQCWERNIPWTYRNWLIHWLMINSSRQLVIVAFTWAPKEDKLFALDYTNSWNGEKCFQVWCAMMSNWFWYLLFHHFVLQT